MKKQINPNIKAHLIRSAFYVLLLLAVCVIPFALAQRNTGGKNTPSKNAASKNVIKGATNRVAPARTTLGPNDPRRKGKSKSASSTRFSNAQRTVPRPVVNAPTGGAACWYTLLSAPIPLCQVWTILGLIATIAASTLHFRSRSRFTVRVSRPHM